jgi:hypothetical protein
MTSSLKLSVLVGPRQLANCGTTLVRLCSGIDVKSIQDGVAVKSATSLSISELMTLANTADH